MKRIIPVLLAIFLSVSVSFAETLTPIPPQTAAATAIVEVESGEVGTLELLGPIGAEEITLERYVSGAFSDSGTWETIEIDGAALTGLTTSNHFITVFGPLYFRINKPDTGANLVGVRLRK